MKRTVFELFVLVGCMILIAFAFVMSVMFRLIDFLTSKGFDTQKP